MRLERALGIVTAVCLFGPQAVEFAEPLFASRLYVEAREEGGRFEAGLWGEPDTLSLPADRVAACVAGEHEVWLLERSEEKGYRLVRVVGLETGIHRETWPWQRVEPGPVVAGESR